MLEYNVTCVVGGQEILCDLKFDKENPAEVSFTFHTPEKSPEWIFSRDLLREVFSSRGMAGEGDVLFYDHGDALSMLLKSPEGTGLALFGRDVVKDFVNEIYEQVPNGEDSYTLDDDTLSEWLEGLV
ncbi:hypothetical protein SEA_PATELGO_216 [Streptomyces phage Patelgo]|nr:hypothetical protein SEA_PATELGO_216 [Streptomyces phage Patelgo]